MKAWVMVAAVLMAGPVLAEALDRSVRPKPNPAYLVAAPAAMPATAALAEAAAPADAVPTLRPRPRPAGLVPVAAAAPAPAADLMAESLRPKKRPKGLSTRVAAAPEEPAPEEGKKKVSKKGSVCGVAAIKGEEIAPIKSKVKGCGLPDGVRVTSVSGVRLSTPATIDCATAKALNHWVEAVLQPAYRQKVVELRIAAHYICRTRNNVKGAKISEHGRGKAVDIAGIVLKSGDVVTVVSDYDKTMRKVHKGACGIFNTTLGPGSDGYHEDHLHFDTAGGRGPYCR